LVVAGAKAGITRDHLVKQKPEVREEAFDSDTKMMATFHKDGQQHLVAVKGAPESVLDVCASVSGEDGDRQMTDTDRHTLLEQSSRMADDGLRILAFAAKTVADSDAEPYKDLTFLALMGLVDPPRSDVSEAIRSCKKAGIRVVMVTGDQPLTARNVAVSVGLIDDAGAEPVLGNRLDDVDALNEAEREHLLNAPIFARVTPEQKLHLVDLHQQNGYVVAMTGDGVNDAPALKKADIGIAMGRRGTQVARETADMVLKDDAFGTIVSAVSQGRGIFENIRKFVVYLLSCNVSEVLAVAVASFAGLPLPLLPLQILFLNLVTDVFPALALGAGEGGPGIMRRSPRPADEPIVGARHWAAIGGYGGLIAIVVLGALLLATHGLGLTDAQGTTTAFLTLAFAQLWHVFNMRDPDSKLLRNDVTRNRYVWGALGLCSGLLLAAVYLPGLASALKTVDPTARGWAVALGGSLVPWAVGQLSLWWRRPRSGARGRVRYDDPGGEVR